MDALILMLIVLAIPAYFLIDFKVRNQVKAERIASLPVECVHAKLIDKRSQLKKANAETFDAIYSLRTWSSLDYNNFLVFEDTNGKRYQFAATDELYGYFIIGDEGKLYIRYDETTNQYYYVNFEREM